VQGFRRWNSSSWGLPFLTQHGKRKNSSHVDWVKTHHAWTKWSCCSAHSASRWMWVDWIDPLSEIGVQCAEMFLVSIVFMMGTIEAIFYIARLVNGRRNSIWHPQYREARFKKSWEVEPNTNTRALWRSIINITDFYKLECSCGWFIGECVSPISKFSKLLNNFSCLYFLKF
jgi:hypothetical protein